MEPTSGIIQRHSNCQPLNPQSNGTRPYTERIEKITAFQELLQGDQSIVQNEIQLKNITESKVASIEESSYWSSLAARTVDNIQMLILPFMCYPYGRILYPESSRSSGMSIHSDIPLPKFSAMAQPAQIELQELIKRDKELNKHIETTKKCKLLLIKLSQFEVGLIAYAKEKSNIQENEGRTLLLELMNLYLQTEKIFNPLSNNFACRSWLRVTQDRLNDHSNPIHISNLHTSFFEIFPDYIQPAILNCISSSLNDIERSYRHFKKIE